VDEIGRHATGDTRYATARRDDVAAETRGPDAAIAKRNGREK